MASTLVQYARLPPPRERLPHEGVIAVLLAAAFSSWFVDMARHYHRPDPPPSVSHSRSLHYDDGARGGSTVVHAR